MSLICLNKLGWNVDKVAFEKEVRDICSDPLIRIKNPNWLTLVFNAESSMKFPNVNKIGRILPSVKISSEYPTPCSIICKESFIYTSLLYAFVSWCTRNTYRITPVIPDHLRDERMR